jgi:hypothetical protein
MTIKGEKTMGAADSGLPYGHGRPFSALASARPSSFRYTYFYFFYSY